MRIQQLRYMLEHVVETYLEMHKLYLRLYHYADGTRAKLLLNYLQQQELVQSQVLATYIETSTKAMLDTWYENASVVGLTSSYANIYLPANMTTDQVIDLHLQLDSEVIATLDNLAANSLNHKIQLALKTLVNSAEIKQQRLIHSAARFDDL